MLRLLSVEESGLEVTDGMGADSNISNASEICMEERLIYVCLFGGIAMVETKEVKICAVQNERDAIHATSSGNK